MLPVLELVVASFAVAGHHLQSAAVVFVVSRTYFFSLASVRVSRVLMALKLGNNQARAAGLAKVI